KPEMKEGAFACLTLFDPETEWTFDKESIQSKSKNSMFIGHGMKGKVLGVIHNDKVKLWN
ncbi:MAG: dihydroorotase, partial [Bacteroidota bacterium]